MSETEKVVTSNVSVGGENHRRSIDARSNAEQRNSFQVEVSTSGATQNLSSLEEGKGDQNEPYFESNAGDGSKATDQHLSGLPLAFTMISCVASLFVAALDQTIVSTILTEVGSKFDSFERVGWLTSGYLLPMATLTPSYGKISIAFGRKNVALAGIFIFEIGSLVSALANSMDMLIGGRVIQGIGGGAVASMVSVILTESVPINRRPLSLMLLAVTYALASVTGPFIGGVFASRVSWRWCFYINLPIGGLAAALLFFSFNPPKPKGNWMHKLKMIDYIGTFMMISGLVLIMLGLTFGGIDFPWKSAAVILCFVLGALMLGVFTWWNFTRSSNPILVKGIILDRKVLAACFTSAFSTSAFITGLTYLAIYFQIIFGESSWSSGINLLPLLVAVPVASIFTGMFIKRTKLVKPVLLACGLSGPIGTGMYLLLDLDSSTSKKIGCLILAGVSVGLQYQGSMISSQLEAPREIEGSIILVTIFLVFLRSIGNAIAVTIAQSIYQTSGLNHINALINSLPESSAAYIELSKYSASAIVSTPSLIEEMTASTKILVLKEIMKTLKEIFYFVLAMSILALITSLFTTNKRVPDNVASKGDDADSKSIVDEIVEEIEVEFGKDSIHNVATSDSVESFHDSAHKKGN